MNDNDNNMRRTRSMDSGCVRKKPNGVHMLNQVQPNRVMVYRKWQTQVQYFDLQPRNLKNTAYFIGTIGERLFKHANM